MTTRNKPEDSIVFRLREGLERAASVARTDAWSATGIQGLNPTQGQVILHLAARMPAGCRVKDIAAQLVITQPTVSDSIAALERKGLVERHPDPDDARATRIRLTPSGAERAEELRTAPALLGEALSGLSSGDKTELLRLVVKLIRQLQIAGAIPVQRMCVNCRHFRPNIHDDAENPHHCAFVDAAFGDRDLRLDCGDHETVDPTAQPAI